MADNSKGQAGAVTAATGLSKKELVRQAIGHLGRDAKALQIQAHIKDKFGVEMSPNHISANKSEILRAAGGAKPATVMTAAKPAAPKLAAKQPATKKPTAPKSAAKKTAAPKSVGPEVAGGHEAGNGNRSTGINLHDIQAAKDLVGRVGAVQLRALIDLLAN